MNTQDQVLRAMLEKGQAMRPGEIAEAAGIDKTDVEKAIKALVKEDKIYSPKRCFYEAKK